MLSGGKNHFPSVNESAIQETAQFHKCHPLHLYECATQHYSCILFTLHCNKTLRWSVNNKKPRASVAAPRRSQASATLQVEHKYKLNQSGIFQRHHSFIASWKCHLSAGQLIPGAVQNQHISGCALFCLDIHEPEAAY